MQASTFVKDREYQLTHINSVVDSVLKNGTTIAQLPTGGGKTVEFALISKKYTEQSIRSVMILVHRIELMAQASSKINAICGIEPEQIIAGTKIVTRSRIYIGMIETVYNRSEYLGRLDIGLLILDECHLANFNKIHSIFHNTYTIGFTATPISSNKKDPLRNYYNSIVCGPSIQSLINDGFLSQNITRCPDDVIDERSLKIDPKTGDFDIKTMAIEYSKPRYVGNVPVFHGEFCEGKKTIIFNVNIEHSLEVTKIFKMIGCNCKHLDGTTSPDEREKILTWFRETEDAILCNVGIVNFGFDEPTVECVIINLATLSLAKWIQCCGRGSRIIDENFIRDFQHLYPYKLKPKSTFNIIDLGLNHTRFGDWNQDRDWARIFMHPDIPGDGLAPVKKCPSCKSLVHAAVHVCPVCEHIFDRKKYEEQLMFKNLVTITKNIDFLSMIEEYKHRKDYFTFFEMGRLCVEKIASFNREFKNDEIEVVFSEYWSLCKKWYRQKFPNNKFNEKWHHKLARDHFFGELKLRFKQTA